MTAASSTPAVPAPAPRWLVVANLALAVVFWGWLCAELGFEWSVSEQYAYGLFVPFLAAYLLWLRAVDRPAPQPAGGVAPVWAILLGAALVEYPLHLIFAANADWRLLAWGQALLALGVSLALLARWGGAPWVRHFAPALLLFLFAVPWPSALELAFSDHLMAFLSGVTAHALRLLGYAATRQGNIIQLPTGYVLVEEACSGVRSVQSTLMAGWLVGELWRYRARGRAGLLVWAAVVAGLGNLLRTFALAWFMAVAGAAKMAAWHDTTGYLVFGGSFATVLLGAWWWRPRTPAGPIIPRPAANAAPGWLPPRGAWAVVVLALGAAPAGFAWYALRGPDTSSQPRWDLNVAYLAADKIQVQMTPEDLRQILFYDVGEQAAWRDRAGRAWMLYYFAWHNPRAAQLGGVHVPERCLPAVGWVLERQDPNLTWARAGVQLVFNCFEFNAAAQHIFVFYCQWDPSNYPYADKTGRFRADRLSDAWLGERMAGKRQLEMALVGMPSLEEAELHLREFLDAAIAVPPNGGD